MLIDRPLVHNLMPVNAIKVCYKKNEIQLKHLYIHPCTSIIDRCSLE